MTRLVNLKRKSKAPIKMVKVPPATPVVIEPAKKKRSNLKQVIRNEMIKFTEKKEATVYIADNVHGQIYTDGTSVISSGHYLTSGITLSPSNGTSDVTRIGNEVAVTGLYNVFQFSHQSNTTQRVRGKIYYVAPRLQSSLATVNIANILNPNTFIYGASGGVNNVYDYMSSRNTDYIKDFKILRCKKFSVEPDLASTTQSMASTVTAGLKFKKPWIVRWNSSNQVVEGQIWMIIVFDSGNSGSIAYGAGANTTGIFKTDVNSGIKWSYYSKTYYVDP